MKTFITFILVSVTLTNILLVFLVWHITQGTRSIDDVVDIFARACGLEIINKL